MFFKQANPLVSVLQERARRFPNKPAYLFLEDGQRETAGMTYGELHNRVCIVAVKLQEKNLVGQRLLLVYPSGPDFIVALLGCLYAGVIAVPVAAPKDGDFENAKSYFKAVVESAEVVGILTDFLYKRNVEAFIQNLYQNTEIFVEDSTCFERSKTLTYRPIKIKDDTIAYLQYTSGSTALPKGVVVLHSALSLNLNVTANFWHFSKDSVSLVWAPHTHVYGLVCGILLPLYRGGLAIVMPPEAFVRRPLSWLQAISKYRVTHSGCPNFGYDYCIQSINEAELNGLNLDCWKVAVNGGEIVRYDTCTKFSNLLKNRGFSLSQFSPTYGMSEANGAISSSPYAESPEFVDLSLEKLTLNKAVEASKDAAFRRVVSSGRQLSGLKTIIVDPETLKPVAAGNIGEIWLSGECLATSYWNNDEETNAVFRGMLPGSKSNYLRTGDLGFLRKGNIYLTGRLKEIIIVNGLNYYSTDLENTVTKVAQQLSINGYAAVLSVLIDEKEELVVIQEIDQELIQTAEQRNSVVKKIQAALFSQDGIDVYAVILVQMGSIPKSSSGKLQRKACRERFLKTFPEVHDSAVLGIHFKSGLNMSSEISLNESAKVEESDNREAQKQLLTEHQLTQNTGKPLLTEFFLPQFIQLTSEILNLNKEAINLNAALSEYHVDSIIMTRLVDEFNARYELHLTPALLFGYSTLREFFHDLIDKNREVFESYHSSPVWDDKDKVEVKCQVQESSEVELSQVRVTDIAIIGMSGVFPQAHDVTQFWENLTAGKDAITTVPNNRLDLKSKLSDKNEGVFWGGFIENVAEFDAAFFNIFPREAELIDPQQRLFLQVVWKTIEDAGYSPEALSHSNTGVFVGVLNNDYAELIQKNNIQDAYVTTGSSLSLLANRISYFLNLKGPSITVDTACSSSLVAIHQAIKAIQCGDCSIAIAGGVNLLLSSSNYRSAILAGMLSPDGKCKTFDEKANGYVRGEGAAAILLKPLANAVTDKDHIYGVIKGSAVNHGGHVSGLTVPNPNAQSEVVVEACQRAGIDASTITYIEAHGTGTSIGDPIEINGLKKAFNLLEIKQEKTFPTSFCGIGSVKTHVGHLESASGIAGVVKVLLAMQHKQLPGNLHFNTLNPQINLAESPFYIVENNCSWEPLYDPEHNAIPRRAGISSFGFGGTNAHIIIEESPYIPTAFQVATRRERSRGAECTNEYMSTEASSQQCRGLKGEGYEVENVLPYYVITISAKTVDALYQRMKDLKDFFVGEKKQLPLSSVSYTLNVGRKHFDIRCIMVVNSIADLVGKLNETINHNFIEDVLINLELSESKTNHRLYQPIFQELYQQIVKDLSSQLAPEAYKNKLLALGNFYIEGYDIDWDLIYKNQSKNRIALPTYPFSKDYYWIPENDGSAKSIPPKAEIDQNKMSLPSSVANVQDVLKHHITKLLKVAPERIDIQASMNELGLDSILLKELADDLANAYQIQINPSLFFTYSSIEALSAYLFQNHLAQVHKHQNELQSYPREDGERKMNEDIAIIGMQGIFPQSENLEIFWNNLLAEKDLIREVPSARWNWADYYGDSKQDPTKTNSKWGGFIDDIDKFDAEFFNISPREADYMDPQHRLFLQIVWKTIEDAGYDPRVFNGKDMGLFVGVEFSEYAAMLAEHSNQLHGYIATGTSHALLANRVSYFFNFHGPSEVVDTACSSSLVAVHRAVKAIHDGECSLAIAGGVSLNLDPKTFVITSQLGVLSPDGRCKTFDKSANGYVKGEGVAAILLKSLKHAMQDGDHIYGVIKGTGVKHSGKTQSLTAPSAAMQCELLMQIYHNAHISPDTVSYIEAHGTGTELGDPIEIEGLKQAFQQLANLCSVTLRPMQCGIGSVKTSIGHLEPASGIAGLIKVLLSMRHGILPSNLHFNQLNPYIDLTGTPFYLVNQIKEWLHLHDNSGNIIPRRAGVSSFGFGGTMAHVVLEEAEITTHITQASKPCYLITLSAKTNDSLLQKIQDLYLWLNTCVSEVDLESLSFTLNIGRSHFDHRVAAIVDSIEALKEILQTLKPGIRSDFYREVDNQDPYQKKLQLLADSYLDGNHIDWNELYANENIKRLAALPTYPFTKQRYWFETSLVQKNEDVELLQRNPIVESDNYSQEDLLEFAQTYLKSIFAEKLKLQPHKIAVDVTYENYGVDSVLGLEITNRLEGDFGTLSKTLLYEKNRICDLASYLQKNFHSTLECLCHEQSDLQYKKPASAYNRPLAPISVPGEFIPAHAGIEINSSGTWDVGQTEHLQTSETENMVAIIGVSGTYPMAENIEELWVRLSEGKDCITEVPIDRWNYKDYPVMLNGVEKFFRYGGFIPDIDKFDPLFFGISPREAELMDPQERLFLQSAWTTLEDAGYTRNKLTHLANNNVGVFVGVTYNFYPLFIAEEWNKGNRLPLDIQNFSLANRVSYFLNINGPSLVVDTACSSSLAAIHLAYESIIHRECTMAIAGGVNLSLHPCKYHMLGSYGFMSDQGRCVSFGAGGSGYVPSEGVGSILLKPLELAIQDKDHIYGVIRSSSMNHGGKTSGYTVPNPNAQAKLVKDALEKAHIDPNSISYIEAHGTGTSLGDPIEIKGLQEAFEGYTDQKQFCAIGSVKSNIGHLEAAAGISQITKLLLQLKYKKLVPSLHAEELNPYIDFTKTPFYVQRELNDWISPHSPRRAGVSSFGAGGTNVHMILEEFITDAVSDDLQEKEITPLILLISAVNAERLQQYVRIIYDYLVNENTKYTSVAEKNKWLRDLCFTSQVGRESMASRIAIFFVSYEDLLIKLQAYMNSQLPVSSLWFNHTVSMFDVERISMETLKEVVKQGEYEKIIQYWVNGVEVPWEWLYSDIGARIISYPTYPFAKRRCWIHQKEIVESKEIGSETVVNKNTKEELVEVEPIVHEQNLLTAQETALTDYSFITDWLYQVEWQNKSRLEIPKVEIVEANSLVFVDEGSAYLLQDKFNEDNCIFCFAGFKFEHRNKNIYYINPNEAEDYTKLLRTLSEDPNLVLNKIIYFASFFGKKRTQVSENLWLASDHAENSSLLLYLFKALIRQHWSTAIQFCFITQGSQPVLSGDIAIWQYHLWNLLRIFSAENQNYQLLLLDLDPNKHLHECIADILNEIHHFRGEENHIAYRNQHRYVAKLTKVYQAVKSDRDPSVLPNQQKLVSSTLDVNLDSTEVYHCESRGWDSKKMIDANAWIAPQSALITGGLGVLGQCLTRWLAENGTRYFLLLGRKKLPEREEWININDDILRDKITTILALEEIGANVKYYACDIADKVEIQVIVNEVEKSWKKSIQGVFHLAGTAPHHMPLETITNDVYQTTLSTKIKGALSLHETFKGHDLDSFVLFSSISAMPYFGVSGISAYATADAFLDGLAAFRRKQNLPAISINWVSWNKGIGAQDNHHRFLASMGISVVQDWQGLEILKYVLTLNPTNISVLKVDWHKFLQINSDAKKMTFFEDFLDKNENDANETTSLTYSSNQIINLVMSALSEALGLESNEIDISVPFLNYGLDSIMGIQFVEKLNQHFPGLVSPMDLYRYTSVQQLVEHLNNQCVPSQIQADQDEFQENEIDKALLAEISDLDDEQVSRLLESELIE